MLLSGIATGSLSSTLGGATGIDRSFAEACDVLVVGGEGRPARWGNLDEPNRRRLGFFRIPIAALRLEL
jgi:hypothetical protein